MPSTVKEAALAALLVKRSELKDDAAKLLAEIDTIDAQVAKAVPFGSRQVIPTHRGPLSVVKSPNHRMSPELFVAQLRPGQVRLCEKRVIDPKVAKAKYPQAYAAALKDGEKPYKLTFS